MKANWTIVKYAQGQHDNVTGSAPERHRELRKVNGAVKYLDALVRNSFRASLLPTSILFEPNRTAFRDGGWRDSV